MAAIFEQVDREFATRLNGVDKDKASLLFDLDTSLFRAGKLVRVMIDGVLHPNQKVDADEVASVGFALLALLGKAGEQLDDLEQHVTPSRWGHIGQSAVASGAPAETEAPCAAPKP